MVATPPAAAAQHKIRMLPNKMDFTIFTHRAMHYVQRGPFTSDTFFFLNKSLRKVFLL